jgi:signal transduction histidine kinase
MVSATNKKNLWQGLTSPHPSITDVEQRRQSHLLAGIILAILATSFVGLVMVFIVNTSAGGIPTTALFLLPGMFLMLILYFINRNGHYRSAAVLVVCLHFSLMHVAVVASNEITWLFFVSTAIILSAIFLSFRVTVLFFLTSVVIQLLLSIVHPLHVPVGNSGPLVVYLMTASLVLVFINHRVGLERERQQELQAANAALRESEALLEKRVADRTRDLEIAADVSKQVATELVMENLLPQLVERTRTGFTLYSVAIFLLDEDLQILRYEAGTGPVGQQQKAEKKHFQMSGQGLVPKAARTRQLVLVNNVLLQPDHVVNPHLPETRSELSVPMMVGDKLIGVLDLQSEQVERFTQDDLRVLVSLSEQLAVAVENARLYKQQVEIAEELRAVDTMKSQFLASMSHELRTPLNAILNFTEFVALGMLGPVNEKQEDALQKALDSGKHLLGLINDVLDITKIEAGMMKLFVEENIDLREELTSIIATAQTLLKDKPVEFIQDIDDDLPLLTGDKRRIRQIMLNLISNAAKFTEEGSVTLGVKKREGEILFAVIDTGPGIATEDQSMIFEPFIQTETGIQHAGGTGLGLPISKRLAEAHGGRLWVESQPGEGASFFAVLPVRSSVVLEMLGDPAEVKRV